ncbi:MAG: 2Fe-2S iron-sulfur cluster binding domain-containing protein [Deltaproteobacteria bacterium]|nr:2Fe-2S iron-sulfur cluster binding domain-containing protein [Deltaproteobacteria bacterium]
MPEGPNRTLKNPVTVTIDGRQIVGEAGANLLQLALDNGVAIPHYCYHPKLSIDGSCRMCQVKIERAPKLAIACNTPITDGMVVDTQAEEVAEARRGVMELLLLNHPLDCPICDQAGECYLQDYSFGYGRQESRTTSPRRKGVKRHPIGPRVLFDEERCILCRRCVRFTAEISETEELRVFGIGDHSHIGTVPGRPLDNPYSINTADVCPVGALLSKDFHHKRRVWFLEETESVCSSCSNGCNIKIGVFRNEIQRLLPRRNDDVNETWMCDAGRLRYAFAHDETRIRHASLGGREIASNGASAAAATADALAEAANRLRAAIDAHGAKSVGVIASGGLTNEECFRLAALVRDRMGTPNVDVAVPMGDSDDFLIRPDKTANARGARDMGLAPGEGGLDVAGMISGAAAGAVKALWVIGSGDLEATTEAEALQAALANVETLILQDTNRSSLTAHAAVVVPGLVWAEKDGTFTNHAGRVQRIRKALVPPAGSMADGEIFARLDALLQGQAPASVAFDARATLGEIASKVAGYAGVSFGSVGSHGAKPEAETPAAESASAASPPAGAA